MRLTGDRLALLTSFGLSEPQARTYLVLLQYPVMPVSALAKASRFPRNRVYEIVEQLQELGLAEIVVDGTRKVRARPIVDFLDTTVGEMEEKIHELESRRDALDAAFRPPTEEEAEQAHAGLPRAIVGRRAIAREIDRLVAGAKSSLVLCASNGGASRLARHLRAAPPETVERILSGDFSLEFYVPRVAAGYGGLEQLLDAYGPRVRIVDAPLANIAVVADERESLVTRPAPDDDRLRTGGDKALVCADTQLVQDQLALLRLAARSATPTPTPRA